MVTAGSPHFMTPPYSTALQLDPVSLVDVQGEDLGQPVVQSKPGLRSSCGRFLGKTGELDVGMVGDGEQTIKHDPQIMICIV